MVSIPSAPTANKPNRTARKPRPRPTRSARISAPVRGCYAVALTVGKETDGYFLEPLSCDFGTAAFRLLRWPHQVQPGEADHYDLSLDTAAVTRSTCECPGFLRHGWHRTPEGELVSCKHLDGLLALVAEGRLALPQRPAQRPALLTAESI